MPEQSESNETLTSEISQEVAEMEAEVTDQNDLSLAEQEAAVYAGTSEASIAFDSAAISFAEKEQAKVDRYRQVTQHSDELHTLRKEYVPKLYTMICLWLGFVALLVFVSGYSADNINNPDCQINCTRFKLTDQVLIAFITTTTATVIGLFVIVAKWLFPSPSDKKEK